MAEALCPLPAGEPLLAQILADHVCAALGSRQPSSVDVLLVDHGSPLPAVTAVRHWLAEALAALLEQRVGTKIGVAEAVMERREGPDYAFNGRLLAEVLDEVGGSASPQSPRDVILAMQFISPGRHAGAAGDIAEIVTAAEAKYPGLNVQITQLMGEHPRFIDVLATRAAGLGAQAPIELTPVDVAADASSGPDPKP